MESSNSKLRFNIGVSQAVKFLDRSQLGRITFGHVAKKLTGFESYNASLIKTKLPFVLSV